MRMVEVPAKFGMNMVPGNVNKLIGLMSQVVQPCHKWCMAAELCDICTWYLGSGVWSTLPCIMM